MSIGQFVIIDSTLMESEQFVGGDFSTEQKVQIVNALDEFGVEYIELTSSCASPQSEADCRTIANLELRCKTLTHIRCHMGDAHRAVNTSVDGVNVVVGTSSHLRQFSHGMDITQIIDRAEQVIAYLRDQDVEVRFSTEDSFRSHLADLLRVYHTVDMMKVDRIGVADTVGITDPRRVYSLVRTLRECVSCDIEFHGHNDSGCAVANAFCALEAGATHVDTSVLGIGERNGITPLGGLIARIYTCDPESVAKYNLGKLRELENLVANIVDISVPFNNPITGFASFTHKAGIHAKAVLNNPATYEAINPADFGVERHIHIAHRLTGWNAVRHRSEQLSLTLSEKQVREATHYIKGLADQRPLLLTDVDAILRNWTLEHEHGKGECMNEGYSITHNR